jgi:hypothetical protein
VPTPPVDTTVTVATSTPAVAPAPVPQTTAAVAASVTVNPVTVAASIKLPQIVERDAPEPQDENDDHFSIPVVPSLAARDEGDQGDDNGD